MIRPIMTTTASRWKLTQQPCPCGLSSDAMSYDHQGNGFCFSAGCTSPFKKGGNELEQEDVSDTSGSVIELKFYPHRGISEKAFKTYNTFVKFKDTHPFEVGFPYPNGAVKVRGFEDKYYHTKGDMKNATLFGKTVCDKGAKRVITVFEGEYDCLAAFDIIGNESACVSVRSATMAKTDCTREYEYINSFEKIVICFDSDAPGQEAAKKVLSLFDFKKTYNLVLDKHKDANAYIQGTDDRKAFYDAWRGVRRYTPDNIISGSSDFKKALEQERESIVSTYPLETLQGMLHGMHRGEVIIIKADEGIGKQLPNTTKIPTPQGWTTMGELKVGDKIFGADGKVTSVTFVTPTQYNIDCFEITFADGTKQISGGPHRWGVFSSSTGEYSVKTTQEMYDIGPIRGKNVSRWSIPIAKALDLPEIELPINPYLLGLWLGDGTSSCSNITVGFSDIDEFIDQINIRGAEVASCRSGKTGFSIRVDNLKQKTLRLNNLIKNKHIPQEYLRASIEQRRELLRGLMDTDGGVEGTACCFYSSNETLKNDVKDLIYGLGYKIYEREKQSKLYGVDKKVCWSLSFLTDVPENVFSYTRKKNKAYTCNTARRDTKTIREITPVESVPSRCITVDNDNHLYLCGEHYTVTHNTSLFRMFENHVFKTTKTPVGILHLEEDNGTTLRGIAAYYDEIPAHIQNSPVNNEEVLEVIKKINGEDDSRIFLRSSFDVEDEDEFIGGIRFLVSGCGCDVVFFDHISWLATGSDDQDERKKLDRISQRLKLLAKELNFCLVMISHVNDDGKTRGSRYITKVANTVIYLKRDKTHEDPEERNKMYFFIEKARLIGAKTGPAGYAVYDEDLCLLKDPYNGRA